MCVRALEEQPYITQALTEIKAMEKNLDEEEWNRLGIICAILIRFDRSAVYVSSETIVTASLPYVILKQLTDFVTVPSTSNLSIREASLKGKMLDILLKRKAEYMVDAPCEIATYLDPRFKTYIPLDSIPALETQLTAMMDALPVSVIVCFLFSPYETVLYIMCSLGDS